MNNTNKILLLLTAFCMSVFGFALFGSGMVIADHTLEHCEEQFGVIGNSDYENCVAGLPAAGGDLPADADNLVSRGDINRNQCTSRDNLQNNNDCLILKYLVNGINFLSAAVAMVIVFSLMWAGYQYMTARDNSGEIQQARTRIIWTISALVIFVFSYAILEFLVPGGVLP